MKLLLKILGGLAVLVLLAVVVAFFLPRHYRVERSVVIAAPAQTIYPLVADLRAWREWGVWYERDPAMVATYSESPGPNEIGGWVAWTSESQGSGSATLKQLRPYSSATYELGFEGMTMKSEGVFELQPVEGGVRVVWSDAGDLGNNPVYRWFGLVLDGMVGPDFEGGLANLKRLAEQPAPATSPASS